MVEKPKVAVPHSFIADNVIITTHNSTQAQQYFAFLYPRGYDNRWPVTHRGALAGRLYSVGHEDLRSDDEFLYWKKAISSQDFH